MGDKFQEPGQNTHSFDRICVKTPSILYLGRLSVLWHFCQGWIVKLTQLFRYWRFQGGSPNSSNNNVVEILDVQQQLHPKRLSFGKINKPKHHGELQGCKGGVRGCVSHIRTQ